MTLPCSMISARWAGVRRGHSSSSVKSGAPAMPMSAPMRSGRANAASRMIQPLMLEPTRICGPVVSESMTAIASSRHRPIVPSAMSPLDAPCPK